jgi:hypothetical protein
MEILCYCPICRNRSKQVWKGRLYAAACIGMSVLLAGGLVAAMFLDYIYSN